VCEVRDNRCNPSLWSVKSGNANHAARGASSRGNMGFTRVGAWARDVDEMNTTIPLRGVNGIPFWIPRQVALPSGWRRFVRSGRQPTVKS